MEIVKINNCIMNFETTDGKRGINNCIVNFEVADGKRGIITIPNICDSNLSITNNIYGTLGIDLSLNASPSSIKELFSVEIKDDKESEEENG